MNRKIRIASIVIIMICLALWGVWARQATAETTGGAGWAQETAETEEAQEIGGETARAGETGQVQETGTGREQRERELTSRLYAKSAVLLDMDSGRVLYEKNGSEVLPMASTTKIMTCIVALELADREDTVTVSAYAAGQPKVHLGMQKGMSYKMDDLLHSLMLESHNDSAVAIAEHIGGKELGLPETGQRTREESLEAVKAFCDKMTEKAREIGCEHTWFLTPNGLDAQVKGADGEQIIHSTTAEDLAKIMRYCVTQSGEREAFLEITRAEGWSFTDTDGRSSYSCINHNAFLTMMDGALSGKTGFTNQAGYCYVGALERDGKRFALALLACGWPNHKTWKWSDSRALFTYGLENYEYREFAPQTLLTPITVLDGAAQDGNPYHEVSVTVEKRQEVLPVRLLTTEGEEVVARAEIQETLSAPVRKGTEVGHIYYYLVDEQGGERYLAQETLCAGETVEKRDFRFVLCFIWKQYLL